MGDFTLATSIVPDTGITFTSTLVIAGFFGVLLLLAVLVLVFSVFSKIFAKCNSSKNKKKEEKAIMTQDLKVVSPFNNASTATAPAPSAPVGVSEEIVAAISAAVYMMDGEGAVVTNITPAAVPMRKNPIKTRNPWAMAAIVQNTKPF